MTAEPVTDRMAREPVRLLVQCAPLPIREERLSELELTGIEGGDWKTDLAKIAVAWAVNKVLDAGWAAVQSWTPVPAPETVVDPQYSELGWTTSSSGGRVYY